MTSELERIRRERDLCLRLLDVGASKDIEPFLAAALALVVEVATADQGYLELHDDTPVDAPRWSIEPQAAGPSNGDLALESRYRAEVRSELQAMGHQIVDVADFDFNLGTSCIVQIDRERGIFLGGADPRGDGVALAL